MSGKISSHKCYLVFSSYPNPPIGDNDISTLKGVFLNESYAQKAIADAQTRERKITKDLPEYKIVAMPLDELTFKNILVNSWNLHNVSSGR